MDIGKVLGINKSKYIMYHISLIVLWLTGIGFFAFLISIGNELEIEDKILFSVMATLLTLLAILITTKLISNKKNNRYDFIVKLDDEGYINGSTVNVRDVIDIKSVRVGSFFDKMIYESAKITDKFGNVVHVTLYGVQDIKTTQLFLDSAKLYFSNK